MIEYLSHLYHWFVNNPQVLVSVIAAIIALLAAVGTIGFNIISFYIKNQREDQDRHRKQKIDWLKTLILDSNLPHFFDFFDNVEAELKALQLLTLSANEKILLIDKINDQGILLRRKFIHLLSAVDEDLYKTTLDKVDDLIDYFTATIADEGINLKHQPKFEEVIINKIIETRTEIIRDFFKFDGDPKRELWKDKIKSLVGRSKPKQLGN